MTGELWGTLSCACNEELLTAKIAKGRKEPKEKLKKKPQLLAAA
jgi:hypothetical protein